MAYSTPYTFIALSVLSAAQLNVMQGNISTLWPYVAGGDIPYASSSTVLTKLAKGTNGQALTIGVSVPYWNQSPASLVLIEEYIVTAGTDATITFSSIPGTYKHLRLFGQVRSNYATLGDWLLCRLNSDSGANYDWAALITGSVDQYVAGGTSCLIAPAPGTGADASKVLTFICDIPYYSKTTWYKNVLSKSGKMPDGTNTHFEHMTASNQWRNTAAITAIQFRLNAGQILQNSIISLYGVP